MTTVAFDGEYLAADGRMSAGGNLIKDDTIKAFTHDEKLIAAAGNWSDVESFFKFIRTGEKPQEDAESLVGWVIDASGIVKEYDEKYCAVVIPYPCAMGTGADIAWGAMAAGSDAKEAVEIACKRDLHSGGQIIVLGLS
jgi:ATP-dependent protease HslVU (ClpYQ) peptidase subunit